MNMSILFYAVKFGNLCRNMPCNNCAFIRVVFFRELYFKEMCGSVETTQKSKRSRSAQRNKDCCYWTETTQKSKRSRSYTIKAFAINQAKQLRRVSGAEALWQLLDKILCKKQLRRVSGAEV